MCTYQVIWGSSRCDSRYEVFECSDATQTEAGLPCCFLEGRGILLHSSSDFGIRKTSYNFFFFKILQYCYWPDAYLVCSKLSRKSIITIIIQLFQSFVATVLTFFHTCCWQKLSNSGYCISILSSMWTLCIVIVANSSSKEKHSDTGQSYWEELGKPSAVQRRTIRKCNYTKLYNVISSESMKLV